MTTTEESRANIRRFATDADLLIRRSQRLKSVWDTTYATAFVIKLEAHPFEPRLAGELARATADQAVIELKRWDEEEFAKEIAAAESCESTSEGP